MTMGKQEVLLQLVAMSNDLGDPTRDYLILGEGNTSAKVDDETFYVKASGVNLGTADGDGFIEVRFDRLIELLHADVGADVAAMDEAVRVGLAEAKVDPSDPRRPSTEAVFHAIALSLEGVRFVGHTHPTAINALTCSVAFGEIADGRLFPDQIVSCGAASAIVPYTDPGLPLARKINQVIDEYIETYNELPKVILMQNHGMVALGQTAHEVKAITAMAVKAARVLRDAYAFGGPHFLTPENVKRIHTRPDEQYRRRRI
jgi:rhamnose utilization protein RhaD (predicted bifunctional aldolase and dehydrogenase)